MKVAACRVRDRCPTCGRTKPPPKKKSKRINPRNEERRKKRMEETFSDQARMCRLVPCCLPRCARQAEPHHWISRGAGGKDAACVPLCRSHHRECEDHGTQTFQVKHGVSLEVVAASMAEAVKAHDCANWIKGEQCQVCLKTVVGPA